MTSVFSALQIIAEQKIAAAQERGEFENLPGMGKPLPEEDLSNVPEELRLAYRMLKNAGYVPEEVANRKEMLQLADLLENGADEKVRLQTMRRLRVLLNKMGAGRHSALLEHDEYYNKILSLLERKEREQKKS